MENFEMILDKDEQIIKEYRPNKKRSVYLSLLSLLPLFLVAITFILIAVLTFVNVIKITDDQGKSEMMFPYIFIFFGALILLIAIYTYIYYVVSYKKRLYCLTNKRIIIRGGFIGVDFNALDIAVINSVNVKVGLLDKMVKPNTGTIIFGSATTPLGQNNKNSSGGFTFLHIDNPYEVYKEIKDLNNIK